MRGARAKERVTHNKTPSLSLSVRDEQPRARANYATANATLYFSTHAVYAFDPIYKCKRASMFIFIGAAMAAAAVAARRRWRVNGPRLHFLPPEHHRRRSDGHAFPHVRLHSTGLRILGHRFLPINLILSNTT